MGFVRHLLILSAIAAVVRDDAAQAPDRDLCLPGVDQNPAVQSPPPKPREAVDLSGTWRAFFKDGRTGNLRYFSLFQLDKTADGRVAASHFDWASTLQGFSPQIWGEKMDGMTLTFDLSSRGEGCRVKLVAVDRDTLDGDLIFANGVSVGMRWVRIRNNLEMRQAMEALINWARVSKQGAEASRQLAARNLAEANWKSAFPSPSSTANMLNMMAAQRWTSEVAAQEIKIMELDDKILKAQQARDSLP